LHTICRRIGAMLLPPVIVLGRGRFAAIPAALAAL